MINQISKHPEELIQIPKFEPEDTFFFNQNNEDEIDSSELKIRLKEFLFTPTVLAIVYLALRSDNESHMIELNDHLAMNILVLISKFLQESENEPNSIPEFTESTVIKYNSNAADLFSQIKRFVFNFKVDDEGNATIQNTLMKSVFD